MSGSQVWSAEGESITVPVPGVVICHQVRDIAYHGALCRVPDSEHLFSFPLPGTKWFKNCFGDSR